ncbi:MAG: hypothetical protein EBY22_07305 [Gammaproteobacteria bacterium]|nr:hypothetical protein [Gammaproteobacteria bacterium]
MGNNGEIFKLDDGSIWQVKYEYEYLYEYYPAVVVCPSRGKLSIGGRTLNVQSLSSSAESRGQANSAAVIESQIEGDFNGWDGETIFKLTNGQIWQQSSYAYTYSYKYRPKVMIVNTRGSFRMQVEGISQSINVTRLR